MVAIVGVYLVRPGTKPSSCGIVEIPTLLENLADMN